LKYSHNDNFSHSIFVIIKTLINSPLGLDSLDELYRD